MQINFTATTDEKRQIEINAAARELTQSEYLRLAALLLINNDDYPIRRPHPDAY